MFGELGDCHQAARSSRSEDVAQHSIGLGQVMHRHRRPGDVERLEVRPAEIQIRPDRSDPIGQSEVQRLGSDTAEHLLGAVHCDHLGASKALRQPDSADAAAGSQIEDA